MGPKITDGSRAAAAAVTTKRPPEVQATPGPAKAIKKIPVPVMPKIMTGNASVFMKEVIPFVGPAMFICFAAIWCCGCGLFITCTLNVFNMLSLLVYQVSSCHLICNAHVTDYGHLHVRLKHGDDSNADGLRLVASFHSAARAN